MCIRDSFQTRQEKMAEAPAAKKRKVESDQVQIGEKACNEIKSVCVFCGSRDGNNEAYVKKAAELGKVLGEQQLRLVYGGGDIGLMGAVARATIAAKGKVVGIIPKSMTPKEISGTAIGEVEIVKSMHERKQRMSTYSDAFIALPGGFGTMEELLECITWQQIGLHNKPIGILNTNGYWDSFLAMIAHSIKEGFIGNRRVVVSADPADLIHKLRHVILHPVSCELNWEES
eukprot:TRINITY_DN22136_c0_g1_i1.p1 TRINITY_DN22136_c0_g1~~TRINITY_DN22136_c0_g1_i1.p1  ORF type:complete len:230 (-),score=41.30 TRINITY_DN22136_c0_g1_i1:124-813(-)